MKTDVSQRKDMYGRVIEMKFSVGRTGINASEVWKFGKHGAVGKFYRLDKPKFFIDQKAHPKHMVSGELKSPADMWKSFYKQHTTHRTEPAPLPVPRIMDQNSVKGIQDIEPPTAETMLSFTVMDSLEGIAEAIEENKLQEEESVIKMINAFDLKHGIDSWIPEHTKAEFDTVQEMEDEQNHIPF